MKLLEAIQNLRLLDDMLMKKVFEDKACTQLMLRIIMDKPDLIVQELQTEYSVKNLQGRSARLDVLAKDGKGVQYNVEVQRADEGAIPKRARYNSSLLDVNISEPGDKYEALPENYVIFITENDVLRLDKPIYHIERVCLEGGQLFNDGSHIIYVNAECQDSTPLGLLMKDFACRRVNEMYYRELYDRVRFFKEEQEGVKIMCKLGEELLAEGRATGRAENAYDTAKLMLEDGEPIEKIMRYTKLTLEQIEAIKKK